MKLLQSIRPPGHRDGTFDHFQVDLPGQRLFVAAEDNHTLEVIEVRTNQLIHTIPVPNTPHSMGYDAELRKLLVADESQVEIYDGVTYKLLETIPMEAHADASVYDPVNKLFYVGNGGRQAKKDYCLITIIDARTN